jgi:hypothetical protein
MKKESNKETDYMVLIIKRKTSLQNLNKGEKN